MENNNHNNQLNDQNLEELFIENFCKLEEYLNDRDFLINDYEKKENLLDSRINELENALRESFVIMTEREHDFFVQEEKNVELQEKVKFLLLLK